MKRVDIAGIVVYAGLAGVLVSPVVYLVIGYTAKLHL